MRVQAINNKHPLRGGVTRDATLQMTHNILFSPARPHGRRQDVPGRDRTIGDQRLGSMPNLGKFHACPHAWLHGTCGMRAFIGLKAGLRVGAHDMHPVVRQLRRLLIQLADGLDVCVTWLRGLGPVGIAPVTRLLRCQVHFF